MVTVTLLNPSNVADPFPWNTFDKFPEDASCLPVMEKAYIPLKVEEVQVLPPIWGWANKGAAGRQHKMSSTGL
jgi:hypothetical protein